MLISSVKNPRVKAAARLRDRSARDEQQRIIVDGRREVARALAAGFPMLEVFYRPDAAAADEGLAELVRECERAGAALLEVTRDVFARLAFGGRDEGLVAVAAPRCLTPEQLELPELPLLVVLDQVEKPGNIGAVLRTADAAGVDALLLTGLRTDIYNPNTIRASLGAVFSLPVVAASSATVRSWCRARGIQLYAARVDADVPYFRADFRGAVGLVLGSEADGLGAEWEGDDIQPVYLPMLGQVDSLNVSAAAAALLYEAVRQRWKTAADGRPPT